MDPIKTPVRTAPDDAYEHYIIDANDNVVTQEQIIAVINECADLTAKLEAAERLLDAAIEISFNGKRFMHKIYKLGGQWSDITKEEWHDSPLEAYEKLEADDAKGED